MKTHFYLSDKEFMTQFSNCTLNPEIFSHEAHLRLAWLLINEFGLMASEIKIKEQLKSFVAHNGAQDKYNETLTITAMKIVNHFMKQSNVDNFKEFIIENLKLKTNFKDLVKAHYSFDVFTSKKAKSEFLTPDLLPF